MAITKIDIGHKADVYANGLYVEIPDTSGPTRPLKPSPILPIGRQLSSVTLSAKLPLGGLVSNVCMAALYRSR